MSAANYTVASGSPSIIFESGQNREYQVLNTGSTTVFLDETRGLSANNGTPVTPGGTKLWPIGIPLFAICSAGETGRINVGVPGAVTDPSVIASAIIDQGLAGRIADAISVAGVPSIDKPALLATGQGNLSGVIAAVDVAEYQSVTIEVAANFPGVDLVPMRIESSMFDLTLNAWRVITTYRFNIHKLGSTVLSLPVFGESLTLRCDIGFNPTNEMSFSIVGSYRNVALAARHVVGPSGTIEVVPNPYGMASGFRNMPAGTSYEWTLDNWLGDVTLTLNYNGVSALNASAQIILTVFEYSAAGTAVNAAATIRFGPGETAGTKNLTFKAPMTPLKIRIQNSDSLTRSTSWQFTQSPTYV